MNRMGVWKEQDSDEGRGEVPKVSSYLCVLQLGLRGAVALTLLHPSPEEGVHDETVS